MRGLDARAGAQQGLPRADPPSLRGAAIINQALGGTEPHDLSKLVAGIGKVTRRAERARAAARRTDRQLQHLLPRLRRPVGEPARDRRRAAELAAQHRPRLRRARRRLPAHARRSRSTSSRGSRTTPATVAAALPWIEQVQASLRAERARRRGQGARRSRAVARAPASEQTPFYQQTELFNKCLTNVIFPAGNTKLQDGASTSGVEDYKEFWYWLVGLAGIGQSFDGNGTMRQVPASAAAGQTLRSAPMSILGHQPAKACSCSPTRRCTPLGHAPGLPRRRAAVQAARALLHAGAARTSTARSPRARRTGAADDARPTATRAGSASATRSSATARRSSRSSR